jgi:hypothetical protein
MQGNVSFIELGTSNTERSRSFFERVFGWSFHQMAEGGGWFQAPSMRVGLHGDDPQLQVYVFFEVPDLEQAMALVREAGGEADSAMEETPGFGRFSNCRDPLGIRFGLHQQSAPTQQSTQEAISDAVITARVRAGLSVDAHASAHEIDVETLAGIVEITGFVDEAAVRDEVLQLARNVQGVRKVKDSLDIRGAGRA